MPHRVRLEIEVGNRKNRARTYYMDHQKLFAMICRRDRPQNTGKRDAKKSIFVDGWLVHDQAENRTRDPLATRL